MALAFGERAAAAGEPPAVALRIRESFHAGCPRSPSTRERIEGHLGHVREAGPGEEAIDLDFDIVRRGAMSDGTLTLSLGGVSVERKASSRSCADVVAALSMMAAIAIGEETERLSDGAEKESRLEPTKPSVPEEATPPHATPPESPALTPTANTDSSAPGPRITTTTRAEQRPSGRHVRRAALWFGTSAEVDGNRGAVLMPSWFGQVTLPVPLEPTLRVGLSRTIGTPAESPNGEATIRWTVLSLVGCVNLIHTEQLRLGPCVNAELGRLEATRVDPLPARELSYFWPSLGPSGRISWSFTPVVSIETTLGLRAPLITRELYFSPDRDVVVYRSPVLVPFVGAGVVLRIL